MSVLFISEQEHHWFFSSSFFSIKLHYRPLHEPCIQLRKETSLGGWVWPFHLKPTFGISSLSSLLPKSINHKIYYWITHSTHVIELYNIPEMLQKSTLMLARRAVYGSVNNVFSRSRHPPPPVCSSCTNAARLLLPTMSSLVVYIIKMTGECLDVRNVNIGIGKSSMCNSYVYFNWGMCYSCYSDG